MPTKNFELRDEAIRDFCRKYQVVSLSLFGSVLRDDFTPESDVDVLVEFQPGHNVGMITFAHMENELTDLMGRNIDLQTPSSLSPYFRENVLGEAERIYVAP